MEPITIKVSSLKEQGFVECPQCRQWHGVKTNPEAYLSKTKTNRKTGEKETTTSVSIVCDECCDRLLDAFSDPDWQLFWPLITEEEAQTIVARIKDARRKQVERFRA